MKRITGQFSILLGALLLLCRCAQVGVLTGGEKDTTPPKLIASSPKPGSTNFKGTKAILEFDEFVQLKDLQSQLIISPQLKIQPNIEAIGKTIAIDFSKTKLLPNTTYRIHFGNAIADMNESNSIDNFDYVIATGSMIDTLKLSGKVVQAFDNGEIAGMQMGLYLSKGPSDSIPYKYEPEYQCKTDKEGKYYFSNLPETTYRLYGINDKNKNMLYDGDLEQITFLKDDLKLKSDSIINLKAFKEVPSKTFIRKTTSPFYGLSQIIMNKPAVPKITTLDSKDSLVVWQENKGLNKDSISFFYYGLTDTLALVYDNIQDKHKDTIYIRISSRAQDKKTPPIFQLEAPRGIPKLKDTLVLNFNAWMDTTRINFTRCQLFSRQDSLSKNQKLSGQWLNIHKLQVFASIKSGIEYTLVADTGAFQNIYGIKNDSTNRNFKSRSATEFGKATLGFKLSLKQNYVIQLLSEDNKVVRENKIGFALSSSNAAKLDFTGLLPGTYKVKIIFDDNNNGKWDTGNLTRQEQAEKVIISSKLIKVVSDWEIEEEIPER